MQKGLFFILINLTLLRTIHVYGSPSFVTEGPNDKSICNQYHRINVTQRVTYTETYFADGWAYRERLNYKTVTVTKWNVVEMCCIGYEPHALSEDAEKCVPICPSGCQQGSCHLPNVCICNPGWIARTNNLTKLSECAPDCGNDCEHGTCVQPNKCDCNEGYILSKDGRSCEPSCVSIGAGGPQGCGDNASCRAPGLCQCNDGYDAVIPNSPVQSSQDENRTTSPEMTTFKPTTVHPNRIVCEPSCDPICDENAFCIAPNKCECATGYRLAENSSGIDGNQCHPICEQTCFNAYCSLPNQCSCNEGYTPHRWLNTTLCEPFCENDCTNGKCTLPNTCECLEGYEKLVVRNGSKQIVSDNVCMPICPGGCGNGSCVAPRQCYCNLGYVLVSSRIKEFSNGSTSGRENSTNRLVQNCKPLCEPGCSKGSVCVAPNQCEIQFAPGKDFNRFSINRVRIINSTKTCGSKGRFIEEHGSCSCNYESDGRICNEPSVCSVIIANRTLIREQFIKLERFVFANNETAAGNYKTAGSQHGPNWKDLHKCSNECRIMILTDEKLNGFERNAENCYRLELYNASFAILSATFNNLSTISPKEMGSLLCFVEKGFGCNASELAMVREGNSGTFVGGLLGVVLLVVIIVAIVLIVSANRKKIFKLSQRASESNVTMMEQSETLESPFNIEDSSHL